MPKVYVSINQRWGHIAAISKERFEGEWFEMDFPEDLVERWFRCIDEFARLQREIKSLINARDRIAMQAPKESRDHV